MYGKLEEPDGLAGLVRLRNGGPRLQDQVLAAEKAGCWSEALALYEQSLQSDAGDPAQDADGIEPGAGAGSHGLRPAQRGHLMCLLQMGHLQGMLAHVDGWLARAPGVWRDLWLHLYGLVLLYAFACKWLFRGWKLALLVMQHLVHTVHFKQRSLPLDLERRDHLMSPMRGLPRQSPQGGSWQHMGLRRAGGLVTGRSCGNTWGAPAAAWKP